MLSLLWVFSLWQGAFASPRKLKVLSREIVITIIEVL